MDKHSSLKTDIFSFSNKKEILETSFQANQGTSERLSMGSRHRRRSVPSFGSTRRSARAGSVDPLLDGSYSDSADSNGKHGSRMTLNRDLDRYVNSTH